MGRRSFVCLFLVVVGTVHAQGLTSSTLEGSVTAEDGTPVIGARISAVGPQGVRTTAVNKRGLFLLTALSPGRYRVEAEAPGLGQVVQDDVLVSTGTRTRLSFKLAAGLEHHGSCRVSLIDPKSTSAVETIPIAELPERLPLGRDLVSAIGVAPGVSDGGALGDTNSSISGASGLENAYFIDGVNITNSGYGALGSYSLGFSSLGTGLPHEFLEQVQVKSAGFEADEGQALGGVVRSTVRSGGNAFDLQVSLYEEPTTFEGEHRDRLDSPNIANTVEKSRREINVSVGGPIVQDRLFYFAAYDPIRLEERFKLTSGDASAVYDLDGDGSATDSFAVGETIAGGRTPGSVTRERSIDNYAGKLSWFATPNHKFEFTAFGDPSEGEVGPQRPTTYLRNLTDPAKFPDPQTGVTGLDWGGDHVAIHYQGGWRSDLFTEVQISLTKNDLNETGPGVRFRTFFDLDSNTSFGGAPWHAAVTDELHRIAFKNVHVIGPVELSYGYQRDRIEWAEANLRGGPTYTAYFPNLVEDAAGRSGFAAGCTNPGTVVGNAACYTPLESTTGPSVLVTGLGTPGFADDLYEVNETALSDLEQPTDADERDAFVQAAWDVVPGVTLKGGLRWTELELSGSGNERLPIGLLPDGPVGGMSTTLTAQSYRFDGEIAPRLGVTWDVRRDGMHKLYAAFGEYFQRVPSSLASRVFSNAVAVNSESFDDSGLSEPSLNGVCGFDADGDGLFEATLACHRTEVGGLVESRSIVLDGSQRDPGSEVHAALGPYDRLVDGAATKLPFNREFLVGYAWQIDDTTTLEARYIDRELPRMVHDLQFASNEQFHNQNRGESGSGAGTAFGDPFPGHGTGAFGVYVLANVGVNVDRRLFPLPRRDYEAIELVFNRRFADGWMAYANYRLARLEGNYEGAFRNDNGSSESSLCSIFDFPAASALDANGDGTFDTFVPSETIVGQYVNGPLNTERRHVFNGFVSRQFDFGLNLGGRLNVRSGQPEGSIYAHPAYRNAGEIPAANPVYWWSVDVDTTGDGVADGVGFYTDSDGARSAPVGDPIAMTLNDGTVLNGTVVDAGSSSGFVTGPRLFAYDAVQRDFLGRTPTLVTLDLHASYDLPLRGGRSRLVLLLDVFNLFDADDATGHDSKAEIRPGAPNPDFGKADGFQPPRYVRLGLKFDW